MWVLKSFESFLPYWRQKLDRDLTEGTNEGREQWNEMRVSITKPRVGVVLDILQASMSSVGVERASPTPTVFRSVTAPTTCQNGHIHCKSIGLFDAIIDSTFAPSHRLLMNETICRTF